jgi:hypothetical protein
MALAIHESGHAVIATVFGIEFTWFTLEVCRVRHRTIQPAVGGRLWWR